VPNVLNELPVKLSELTLRRPRVFGDRWLACRLWDEPQTSFRRSLAPERDGHHLLRGSGAGDQPAAGDEVGNVAETR
jgi:hypothetical protein